MKLQEFYYVHSDFEAKTIFTCGATFSAFMEFIVKKPNNLLLVKASFGDGKYDANIGLDRVDSENMNTLIDDDIASYGDFVWVDYQDAVTIDLIHPSQLAELLYLGHTFKPLNKPFIKWLGNDYIYLAHDDDFWTKIYLKNIQSYQVVMHGIILATMQGRKKSIEPIPSEIIHYIFEHSQDGLLFDFENIFFYNGKTVLNISKLGKKENYDDIYGVFKRRKYHTNVTIELVYDSQTRKWVLSNLWK